jgi:mono/diheme cytochrome c family protein
MRRVARSYTVGAASGDGSGAISGASIGAALLLLLAASAVSAETVPPASVPIEFERGRRVFEATGGCTCHTNYPGEGKDAPELAGGRAMETPFGIFYSTNITPDPATGLGNWSDEDFIRAMRQGLSPEGEHYFPVFPYPAFTGLRDQDLLDLKAYLDSRPKIERANKPPDAPFPFSWRATVLGWKILNFDPTPITPDESQTAEWNRGRYLVNAAAHCGECHTPRTLTGGLDRSLWLAGSRDGPEGELAPNITPDRKTGIGDWSTNDMIWYLETGLKPDGDDTQGLMSEVIEHGYSKMDQADLRAIAVYLKSLDGIENRVKGGKD